MGKLIRVQFEFGFNSRPGLYSYIVLRTSELTTFPTLTTKMDSQLTRHDCGPLSV